MTKTVEFEEVADDYGVAIDGRPLTPLRRMLGSTGDLDTDLDTHPADQAGWEITASYLAEDVSLFTEIDYRRFMAHARRYARLALRGQTIQATIEALKDAVVLVFSGSSTAVDREMYGRFAFRGHLLVEREMSNAQALKHEKTVEGLAEKRQFLEQMFRPLNGRGEHVRSYEAMVRRRLHMQGHVERVRAIAAAHSSRGFTLQSRAKLEGPKFTNQAPMTSGSRDARYDSPRVDVGARNARSRPPGSDGH